MWSRNFSYEENFWSYSEYLKRNSSGIIKLKISLQLSGCESASRPSRNGSLDITGATIAGVAAAWLEVNVHVVGACFKSYGYNLFTK